MNEARIALSRVQMRDSFVMPETADIFISHITQFAQTDASQSAALQAAQNESLEQAYGYDTPSPEARKPFVYQDGFAIIPIHGVLLNRFGGAYSFATGYNYIRRTMNAALEDSDVKVIVFDCDSPGGEAAGCFELANEIRAAREVKPILAVVDSLSASAGYALASAATSMVATPSSKIGSIGVIRMHMNMKGALDKMGIEVTIIEAPQDGSKSAGSPYRALTPSEKQEFQESVDKAYDDFVDLIVSNRGMDADAVRETKAKVFRSDEALALGLIDAVRTPSEAVSSFMAELAEEDPTGSEEEEMTTKTSTGSEATSAAPAPAAPAAVSQEAIAAAIQADRDRMSAIKGLDEAAERPKLADTLALQGLGVDQAKTILASAAVETPAAPVVEAAATTAAPAAPAVDTTNHLAAAMDGTEQPNVGAGEGNAAAASGEPTSTDLVASILRDQSAETGRVFESA